MRPLISMLLLFALSACGTRGALQLPPGPPPPPLLGKSAPYQDNTADPQSQQSDHSNNPAYP